MAVDDININVKVSGTEQIKALSHAMRQLNAGMLDSSASVANLDARAKSLSTALGRTDKGMSDHAKTLGATLTNQRALGAEIRNVNKDIASLTTGLARNSKNAKENAASLGVYNENLKGIKIRAFKEDLAGVTQEMRRMGKDAQFTGRAMTVGLTVPILAFGRMGLQSVVAVDKQLARLNKIFENTARDATQAFRKMGVAGQSATEPQKKIAEEMVSRYNALDDSLTAISQQYGVARDLVIGLAGDFAELGLQANESSVKLTELTIQAEKLGDLNITGAKDLIQTIYQNATTALLANAQARGVVLNGMYREKLAIDIATAQLAAFNQIENVTALSLRDISKAFPEVAATATAFGISMTEVIAILAPMKAAGFDVGASATAIKVSLQRLNDPTEETKQKLDLLAKTTGYDFPAASGIGINSLDRLAQAFTALSKTAYGTKGTLEFFTQLFGTRQSTRMEVSIRDMATFNSALSDGFSQEGKFASAANETIEVLNRTTKSNLPLIKTFSDLGNVSRISAGAVGDTVEILDDLGKTVSQKISQVDIDAATKVRNETANMILQSRKDGIDLLAKVSSQSGKALFVEFAGGKANIDLAEQELKTATSTIDASIQRVRNNFKLIAASIIENLRPVLEFVDRWANKIADFFNKLPAPIRTVVTAFLGFTAILGPLKMGIGAVSVAFATIAGTLFKFLPGLSKLTAGAVSASAQLMYLNNPLISVNGNIETTASKFSILVAKLASGDGRIANVAKKFGLFNGILSQNVTASAEVVAAVEEVTFVLGRQQAVIANSTAYMNVLGAQKVAHQALTDSIIVDINKTIAADMSMLGNTANTAALQEAAIRQYGATFNLTSEEIEAAVAASNISSSNSAAVAAKSSASKTNSILATIAAHEKEADSILKVEIAQVKKDIAAAQSEANRIAREAKTSAKIAEKDANLAASAAADLQLNMDRELSAQAAANSVIAAYDEEVIALAAAEQEKRAIYIASAEVRLGQLRLESAALAEIERERFAKEASASIRNPKGQFLSKAQIAENAAKKEAAERTGILQEKGFLRPRVAKGEPGAGQMSKGVFPNLGPQKNDEIAILLLQEKKKTAIAEEIALLEAKLIAEKQLAAISPMLVNNEQVLAEALANVSGAASTSSASIKELVTGAINPHIASQEALDVLMQASINVTEALATATTLEAKAFDSSTIANNANTLSVQANSEVEKLNLELKALQANQIDLLARNKGKLAIASITEADLLDNLNQKLAASTFSIQGNGDIVSGVAVAYQAWEAEILASSDMSTVLKLALQNENSSLQQNIYLLMEDAKAQEFKNATNAKSGLLSIQNAFKIEAENVALAKQVVINDKLTDSIIRRSIAKVKDISTRAATGIGNAFVGVQSIPSIVKSVPSKVVRGVFNAVSNGPISAGVDKIKGQKSLTDLETAATKANTLSIKENLKAEQSKAVFNKELSFVRSNNISLENAMTASEQANTLAVEGSVRAKAAQIVAEQALNDEKAAAILLTEANSKSLSASMVQLKANNILKAAQKELDVLTNAGMAGSLAAKEAQIVVDQAQAVANAATEVSLLARSEATAANTVFTEAQTKASQAAAEATGLLKLSEDLATSSIRESSLALATQTTALEQNAGATKLKAIADRDAAAASEAATAATAANNVVTRRQSIIGMGGSAKGSGLAGLKSKIVGQTGVRGVKEVVGVAESEGVKAVSAVKGVTAVKGSGIKGLIGSKAIKAVAADAATGAEGVAAAAGTGLMGIGSKITGLVKSFFSLGGVLKMVKFALMGTFAVAAIVVVVGVVAMLVSGFKKFDKALAPVKQGLEALKAAFSAVITPIKDAIATLLGFGADGKTSGSKNPAAVMQNIGETIKSVAVAVADFVTKYIVPFVEDAMNRIINLIKGIVNIIKGVINIFKGDWKEGLGQILKGVGTVFRAILKTIKASVDLQITIFQKGVDLIIGMFFGLGKAIVQAIGGAIEWVLDKFADIGQSLLGWVPGFDAVYKTIRNIGKGISNVADDFGDTLDGWGKKVTGAADKVVGYGKKVIDGVFNTGDSLLKKISDDWVDTIKGAGDSMTKAAKDEAPKVTQIYTDAAGTGLTAAEDKFKDIIKDVKQKFTDVALDIIGQSIQDAVDKISTALQKQKDAALNVYDVQLETLNKLEKAEQSLTQEMQYQSDRRRMIAERALQVENYQRNRALAIYEGRIDDARVLSLEDANNKISFAENVSKLDSDRQKTLAAENLSALRDSIAKAKEETARFFDETIKNYQDAAAEITKFPPLTVEQYANQLDALNVVGTAAAEKNGAIFKDMMSNLVAHLSDDLPNQGVPVFITALDQLVAVAESKYGLSSTGPDGTIIGATIGMLMGIVGQVAGSSDAITASFGSIVNDIQGIASVGLDILTNDVVQPALDALTMVMVTHNPFEVFADACVEANQRLLYDMQKTFGAIGSVVDGLGNHLDDLIVKLVVANAVANEPPLVPGDDGYNYNPNGLSFAGSGAGGGYASRQYANRFGPIDPNFTPYPGGRVGSPSIAAPKVRSFNGGYIRKFAYGGFNVPGFESQGVPAMLHGGEFVINAAAVKNIGMATLTGLNNMRFQKPVDSSNYNVSGGTTNNSTINIIVDQFIGEDQWFNELVKKYNMNVVPRNQKSAGLEGRVLTSYSGLSRGM